MYRLLTVVAVVLVGVALLWPQETSADTELLLQPGLNEFVYTGETSPVAEALNTIEGLYDVVYHWDIAAQVWRTFRPPPAPAFLSDFELMEPGKIYWVVVAQQLQLTITEPDPPSPFLAIGDSWVRSDGLELTLLECGANVHQDRPFACSLRLSNTGSRVISELSFPNDAARFRSVPGTAISVYFTDDTPGATDCFDLPDQIQICPHTDLLLNPGDSVTYVITDFWGNCFVVIRHAR